MTASDDNTAASIPGVIRDPITAANLLRVNADGSINVVGGGAAAAGRLLAVQTFTTHQTVTPTYNALTTSVVIVLVGAGGGGGAASANPGAATGFWGQPGGGGAYLRKRLTTAFSGKQLIVGTGGAGGTAGANAGANGTATSFDAGGANYSAGPGIGGATSRTVTATTFADAPIQTPATASNGDVNVSGDIGTLTVFSAGALNIATGQGGSSPFGRGGIPQTLSGTNISQAGAAGQGNGSGGSAGATFGGTAAAVAGGAGTDGYAEIWEYS